MKLLAINFGGIGDEILFLPTLKSIRSAHPDWRITLLVEPRSASVADVTDLCDAVVTFDIKKRPFMIRDMLDLLTLIRDGGYDAVVSSGSSNAVPVLLFLTGIKTRVGYDGGRLARMLLTRAVPLNRNQYAAYMYHDLVAGLGIEASAGIPKIRVGTEASERMSGFLGDSFGATAGDAAAGHPLILLHPGTSKLAVEKGVYKTWRAESWAELIRRLMDETGARVVLAGGPEDAEIVSAILIAVGNIAPPGAGSRFASALGVTRSLADLAALMNLCNLIVCVDSGPMHLGVGLGKPLVALFGPTDEGKLLPADERFLALRPAGSKPQADPFKLAERSLPASADLDVPIPPHTVYQAVLDRLSEWSARGSSPEYRR